MCQNEDDALLPSASRPQSPRSMSVERGPASQRAAAEEIERLLLSDPGVDDCLVLPPDAPQTLAQALERAARRWPDHTVIHLDRDGREVRQPYPALLVEARRIRTGLRAHGQGPGAAVLLLLEKSDDIVPAFWACLLGGNPAATLAVPPVFRAEHQAVDRLLHAWEQLGEPVVVSSRRALTGLRAMCDGLGLQRLRALDHAELRASPERDDPYVVQPDDVALYFLTSGSTGRPKLVPLRHRNLCAHSAASGAARGQTSSDVSLNWMPLDHVGSCVMFGVTDIYVGSTQIHGATSAVLANPLLWLDWIDRFRVNFTWAPNFAYALIVEQADQLAGRKWDLGCARFFLNAGEAVVARTSRRFLQLLIPHGLPATALHPGYGMSELCSAITYSRSFTLATTRDEDQHVDVGRPSPGVQIRVVDPAGFVVPEGRTGALEVHGAAVMNGYHARPQANAEAFSPDGWFRTGDLAFVRDGSLTITGRAEEVVVVNGVKYPCRDIEIAAEEVPGVEPSYTAACPVRAETSDTDQVVVFFHTLFAEGPDLAALVHRIGAEVARRIGMSPSYVLPVAKEEIPRTSIGKIERSTLRRRFEGGEFVSLCRRVDGMRGRAGRRFEPRDDTQATIARVWRQVLGAPPLDEDESFLAAGGDSLRAAQLAGRLSEALSVEITLHQLFESPTVVAIARCVSAARPGPSSPGEPGPRAPHQMRRATRGTVTLPEALRRSLDQARKGGAHRE